MTPWLKLLGDYPVLTAGLIMALRGIGNFATIMASGHLGEPGRSADSRRLWAAFDVRLVCVMTGWTPDVSQWTIV